MENHRVRRNDNEMEREEDKTSECELIWNESYPIRCTRTSVGCDNWFSKHEQELKLPQQRIKFNMQRRWTHASWKHNNFLCARNWKFQNWQGMSNICKFFSYVFASLYQRRAEENLAKNVEKEKNCFKFFAQPGKIYRFTSRISSSKKSMCSK